MPRPLRSLFRCVLVAITFALTGAAADAGLVTYSASPPYAPFPYESSPAGAWSYSELVGPQAPGSSITYFPTSTADYSGAVFQGYVKSDAALASITGGTAWFGTGLASYQIFRTTVVSEVTQTVPVYLSGDDGHSLFVDGAFVGGSGFGGVYVDYNLALQAGVPRQLEIAGYNGPNNWVFAFGVPFLPHPANNPVFRGQLEAVPGITINADGITPAPTPEPATLAVFGALAACALGFRRARSC